MGVRFTIAVVVTGLSLVGCGNKVNFSDNPVEGAFVSNPVIVPTQPNPPEVEDPPVVIPPTPQQPSLSLKAGTCAVGSNEQVLSCLDCESTAPIPAEPILSRKAQELLDIMTVGCSIHNKSDPRGYVPPTRAQLLKRIIQCSPTAYPDTAWELTQKSTIGSLLTNATAQKSAFGGLYYNWATTDFETYFGLDIADARYTFCRHDRQNISDGGVYPKEYYDSLYDGSYYVLPPVYVRAQKIRSNLRGCIDASIKNPNVPQPPATPGETCTYETAEGEMSELVVAKVHEWQAQGHEVYFEGFGQCGIIDRPEQFLDNNGFIKIAIKKCQ